ncbi:MAG TPA: glycosyltransferase [Candidatus Saccharimonadales bacterium]
MNRALDKTLQVYKNQGLVGVAKKGRSTLKYRTRGLRRRFSPHQETLEQKDLREEFDFVSNKIFQITAEDIERSKQACKGPKPESIKTATWFIPYYNHFGFNGIQTIFRFIEKLSQEGVKNTIVIYDNPTMDTTKMRHEIETHFPDTKNYEIIVFGDDKLKAIEKLPPSDIAFCTIWVSAYVLLHYNQTKRKYYFIQDYEPLFYVAGSTSALSESTYRFGFKGVVNTPGLLAAVNQGHGLEGVSFIPAVNHALYYPDPKRDNEKVRIFFYARPSNPRNAFNLGILTIKQLLKEYGKRIEIITAGAEWNESQYDLKGKITNLGLIKSLDEVAALYRTCDIGFAFMLNKHTTYQMMEYSASGMATVMNNNEDHHWLHKDGKNCLLAEPSPSAMAEKIGLLIDDPALRKKLVNEAQKSLGYTWDQQTEMIWNEIKNG